MASEKWKERPGGKTVRWRNKDCEKHPWGVPKWFQQKRNRKTRREVRQLLDKGRYEEAEIYGNPPLPWYF